MGGGGQGRCRGRGFWGLFVVVVVVVVVFCLFVCLFLCFLSFFFFGGEGWGRAFVSVFFWLLLLLLPHNSTGNEFS